MHANISVDHGIEIFEKWLSEHSDETPPRFNKTLFLELLKIVMTRNVFEFGDTCWLQKLGTAMGACCACACATLHPACHERTNLLPKFKDNLPFLCHFIDDKFGIWLRTDDQTWENFKNELNNFGKLIWKVSKLSTSVDFLDLTIAIDKNRHVYTKTYEKPMNLYLYIPPASAHPPGIFRSVVFGNLK